MTIELKLSHQPGYADLTAEDKALIKRGGAVGFEEQPDGTYTKTIREPGGSFTKVEQHKRLRDAEAKLAELRRTLGQ